MGINVDDLLRLIKVIQLGHTDLKQQSLAQTIFPTANRTLGMGTSLYETFAPSAEPSPSAVNALFCYFVKAQIMKYRPVPRKEKFQCNKSSGSPQKP